MKFAVGYQIPQNGERFSEIVDTYKEHIKEVYFSWPGMASGRPQSLGHVWYAQQRLEEELLAIRRMGIKLDLLLNANCYGANAISNAIKKEIIGLLEYLAAHGCCPEIVTTASPYLAHILKEECPLIEIRASVNMRIGTIQALEYASEYFDSFYLQRDYQRNIKYVREVHEWCEEHQKKLCVLANSGCLRFCPSQTFHDNLIAHSQEAETKSNLNWNPHLCRKVYSDKEHYVDILKSTWIRPEDIRKYEGLVDVVKLATRQHSHPRMVIGAYSSGNFDGNLLELLEPGFATQFFPYYIENKNFPPNWHEKSGRCLHGCTNCGYCESVLEQVLGSYDEIIT